MMPEAAGAASLDELEARVRTLRRRSAASRAAYSLHLAHPELARQAGAKGGATRGQQLRGRRDHMQWVARRRWYGSFAGPPPAPAVGGTA